MLNNKLREIIAIVEASNVSEVEVSTWWGRKIRVRKGSADAVASAQPPALPPPAVPLLPEREATPAPEPVVDTSKLKQIQAPIVGTFYRAPSTDAAPYINTGDRIEVGQVICIIEAMKIMNEIESDVSGTVVDILAENATPVEFNQALVVVDPS